VSFDSALALAVDCVSALCSRPMDSASIAVSNTDVTPIPTASAMKLHSTSNVTIEGGWLTAAYAL
jgi:hypothetical protein